MSKGLAIIATAAAAAAGIYALRRHVGADDCDDDVDDELPSITVETVVEIFSELTSKMNESVTRMMRSIQEHKSQGHVIPEAYLQQVLVQQFETTLAEAQEELFKLHSVDEEDLEEAVTYYEAADQKDVVESVQRFRQLYISIGGSIEVDLPEDLDVDNMCELLEEYMEAFISAQEEVAKLAKGQIIADAHTLQQMNQRTVQEKTSEVLERYGLTQLVFQSAIKKFSEDDKFQAQIKEIENKQARRMKALADIGLAGAPLG